MRRRELRRLKLLLLNSNQIGDVGMTALSAALGSGALPRPQRLRLRGNSGTSEPILHHWAATGP